MLKPVLYACEIAPPCRFVAMAANLLGIELEHKFIDIFNGDQYSERFGKLNALRKVPVLQHKGLTITDSSAISIYLCETTKDNNKANLYPKTQIQRVRINEMLFYHSGVLFPQDSRIMSDYFAGQQKIAEEQLVSWNKSLDFLESKLEHSPWCAGEEVTLADLCCFATISSMMLLTNLDVRRHGNIDLWLKRFSQLPCYDINLKGLLMLKDKLMQYKK